MVDLNKIINITRYIFPVVIIALVIVGMVMPLGNKFSQKGGDYLFYDSLRRQHIYTDEITDELYINKYCRTSTKFNHLYPLAPPISQGIIWSNYFDGNYYWYIIYFTISWENCSI
jgi:hypothetical protein